MICTQVGCRPPGPATPALGCDTDSDCVPPLRCVGIVCTEVSTPTATPTFAAACTGDCDRDGFVRVHELVKAVRISLGLLAVESCAAADPTGDRNVSIADLMLAVNAAADSRCR